MKDKKLEKLTEKIRQFEKKSSLIKTILRPSIPPELEELQKHIINSHIEIEKLMSEMIRVKLWARVYDKSNPLPSIRLLGGIYQVVEYLPYKEKNRVLISLEPLFKPLKNRIKRMNEIRNEFAHTELRDLVKEYNLKDKNGAQKILYKYEFVEKLKDDIVNTGLKVKDYHTYAEFIKIIKGGAKKRAKK